MKWAIQLSILTTFYIHFASSFFLKNYMLINVNLWTHVLASTNRNKKGKKIKVVQNLRLTTDSRQNKSWTTVTLSRYLTWLTVIRIIIQRRDM